MSVVTQIQIRRGTAAQWTSANPILASGEFGFETDTGKAKIGNGSTVWNSLAYSITGDVGDITGVTAGTGLTGGGTSGSVTLAIDSTVATLTGGQTLTNKTIALGNNTVSGTIAEFNTALTDGDFATLAGGETLTNKTISGSNNTLSNIGNSSLTNSSITINGAPVSLGGSVTIEASSFVPSFMLGGM